MNTRISREHGQARGSGWRVGRVADRVAGHGQAPGRQPGGLSWSGSGTAWAELGSVALALQPPLDVTATFPGPHDVEADAPLHGGGQDARAGPVPMLGQAPVQVDGR